MASPFSIFRRHQGVLLAVFGVAIMVAFVILPSVIQLQQSGGGGGNYSSEAVMTWTGGEVTETDVGNMMRRRDMVLQFLARLQEAASKQPAGKDMNRARDGGMLRQLQNNNPSTAVATLVLAQKANDMGLSVSQEAARAFLHNVTDDVFAQEGELDAAISSAIDGSTTPPAMFDALRTEMLAHQVMMMGFGAPVTTPGDAWEYYNRLTRRVSAEFVPFAVANYVDEVPDPSSSELKKYFEEHKRLPPSLNNDEPGFKVPRKVELYYVVAEYDKFLQKAKTEVTKEEIEKYYESNKDNFKVAEDEFPVDEVDPDDPRSAIPSPPTVSEEPASDDEDEKDPAAEPDTVEPSNEEAPSDCDEETSDDSSVAETEDDSDASDASDSDDGAAGEGEPEAEPTTDAPADTTPADDAPDEVETSDEEETGGTSDDDLTLPEPKYKPLSEVEEQIRTQLARPIAQLNMEAALAKVRTALDEHYEKVLDYELDEKDPPETFDGKAIAQEVGLKHAGTKLTDVFTLYKARDELDIVRSSSGFGQQSQSFLDVAFAPGKQEYQQIETRLGDPEKIFLAWKVDEQETYVPELAEVKNEVIKTWKLQKAQDLAKSAADKFAAGLDGKESLKGQVGGREVLQPAAFSYFTEQSVEFARLAERDPRFAQFGNMQPQPDSITDIEEANDDTLRKEVVAMPVSTIRVLPNSEKSIYYVVRVASDNLDQEEARKNFMQDVVDSPQYHLPRLVLYASDDPRALFQEWLDGVEDEYEVERVKPEYFLQQR